MTSRGHLEAHCREWNVSHGRKQLACEISCHLSHFDFKLLPIIDGHFQKKDNFRHFLRCHMRLVCKFLSNFVATSLEKGVLFKAILHILFCVSYRLFSISHEHFFLAQFRLHKFSKCISICDINWVFFINGILTYLVAATNPL